jgi:hypothetical protein
MLSNYLGVRIEPLWSDKDIIVGPDNESAGRCRDCGISRVREPRLRLEYSAEREQVAELFKDDVRVVSAIVVDHQQFPGSGPRRVELPHSVQRTAKQVSPVPGTDCNGKMERSLIRFVGARRISFDSTGAVCWTVGCQDLDGACIQRNHGQTSSLPNALNQK